MKKLKSLLIIFLIVSILPGMFTFSAFGAFTDNEINEILVGEQAKYGSNNLDELISHYSENAGGGNEWIVYALSLYKTNLKFQNYCSSLLNHAISSTENSVVHEKYALLFALNNCNEEYVQNCIDTEIGTMYMSYVFGLHILNNGFVSKSISADDVINKILSLQLFDGGWALNGTQSDVDVTAMTIQSLAPYYAINNRVKTAVDKALNLLSLRQMDNGGYKSYGLENCESSAQVVIALSALEIDCENDARFIKNGVSVYKNMLSFKVEAGKYSHTVDGNYNFNATSQVLLALISVNRQHSGKGSIYQFKTFKPQNESTSKVIETTTATPTKTSSTGAEEKITTVTASSVNNDLSDSVLETEQTAETTLITSAVTEQQASVISENSAEEKSTADNHTQTEKTAKISGFSVKIIICSVIALITVAFIIYLWVKGNKKILNYLFIVVISLILIVVTLLLNIQTKDEFYSPQTVSSENLIAVTVSVRCDTVAGRGENAPESGEIFKKSNINLPEGSTVYDSLIYVAKENGLIISDKTLSLNDHSNAYISGINNLCEFDYGETSGWIYKVNGQTASVGCGVYELSGGDNVEWLYTVNMGEDLK